ncbi:MAG: aldehyde dehydrogenase family protein [Fimbriimonadaceae bacterium]|nr:aldehyde dehydrogenase family protein [Fimbriimonadaceae bacterium]
MSNVPVLGSFIGGAFVAPHEAGLQSVNPSDVSDIVAEIGPGSSEEVAAACSAATDAQTSWQRLAGPARADHLMRWADSIQNRAEELAQMVCREVGKPIGEARGEVGRCSMILRYFAGEAVREIGEVIPAQAPGTLQFSLRQALGVVGLITPWNFPVAIPLWKAAPALAFGNTVVLKPSEMSPACANILAQTAQEAGLPAGVFNVVQGAGQVGESLCLNSVVRAISFTGSARVGKIIARLAADRNIKFQTEMGGKNVAIILDDANIALAANLVAAGAMRFAGQKCTATSRAIVVRSQLDAFVAALRTQVEGLMIGPVTDPASAIGPVISSASQQRIVGVIEGAEPVLKTQVPDDLRAGTFVPPTIVLDVSPSSTLAQNEIFGPVLAVMVADDLDHALELANGTEYGLSASLFTSDLKRALTYIDRIEAGMVRVNGDTTGVDPHAPFGGVKGSSSGSREQGPAAKEFYTEIKTVQINPG